MDLERIRSIEIFKTATDEELEGIVHTAITAKTFEADTLIVSIGEQADYVYFVIAGHLQVYLDNSEGKQVVIKDLFAGDCFGELGVFCNATRCANIVTKSTTNLLAVSGKAYLQYCRSNHEAAKIIIDKLASSLTKLTKDYHSLALNNLDHRLVRTLIEISERVEGKLEVAHTHSQIANRVAATRESVSRAISALNRKGLINNVDNKIILNNKLVDLYSQL